MILSEFRKAAHEFTSKLSDINRNLAFAGIAIVWVFKSGDGKDVSLDYELITILYFVVSSLIIDLIQYIYASIIWTWFHRTQEDKEQDINTDIKAPKWISNFQYFFFFVKVLSNIIAYLLLFKYISKIIFST